MKVSIIIPVYNAEKFLDECINSALNQTYGDIEIIAIDDGSTDKSLSILQKYSDQIKIISKENGGAASALNAGIKESIGEWIKWLNADDVLYPDAIDNLLVEAMKTQDKTNTIFYGNFDLIDSDGKIIGRKLEPDYDNLDPFDFNVILLDHHIGNQNTVLIHRTTLEIYGMFDGTCGQEDYEFHLRLCLVNNCRLKLIKKTLAKYRIHPNQISRANVKAPTSTEAVRSHVLSKLAIPERKMYEDALAKYRQNRTFTQKTLQFLGKSIFRILPTSIASKIAMRYIRVTLGHNYEKNDYG